MKSFIIPGVLFFLIATGCKKDKQSKPAPVCRVNVITTSTGYPYNIYYDNNGRIETIRTGTNTISIVHNGDSIIATQTINNNTFYQRRRYKMAPGGFPSAVKIESDPSGNSWANLLYEYSGTELRRITITTSASSLSSIINYYWSNGNLDSIKNGTNTDKYEYYTDKPFRTGDAANVYALLSNDGVETIRTKNMRKVNYYYSPLANYEVHYNYVFDSDGKVTSVINENASYSLQYQCN